MLALPTVLVPQNDAYLPTCMLPAYSLPAQTIPYSDRLISVSACTLLALPAAFIHHIEDCLPRLPDRQFFPVSTMLAQELTWHLPKHYCVMLVACCAEATYTAV